MKRLVLSLLVAPCLVASLVVCGGEEGIGEAASAALSPHVRAVRVAARGGDRDAALAHLGALRQEVAQLRRAGELSSGGAATVLDATLDVERQLLLLPAPARRGANDGARSNTTSPEKDDDAEDNAAEEARKRAEEAAKKAEEEAKKLAEEAKKRAEDVKKE
ncbi:MAG: hypothetical protein M3314_06150 [Actinomycetota bacterium]|nr:hypothetical protein [Actinomycetota bacterium]